MVLFLRSSRRSERELSLTRTAVGSVSDVARKEHIGSFGATVAFHKCVFCARLSTDLNPPIEGAVHCGVNENVVHALGPSEDHSVSNVGREFFGAIVWNDPAKNIDDFLAIGKGSQLGKDQEGD